MEKKKVLYAEISLVIVTIIWGLGFPIAKIAFINGFNTYQILFFRFGIATIMLPLIFHKRIKLINKDLLKGAVLVGLILYMGFFLQTMGLSFTTSSKNAFITQMAVIITPFVYWLIFRRNVDKYSYIAAFIALIGMGTLTLDGTGLSGINIGDIMTLGCAISIGFHVVLTSHYVAKYNLDPVMFTFIQMVVCAFLSGVMLLVYKNPVTLTFSTLWAPVFLGVFNTALGFTVQTVAIKYTSPTRTSIIVSSEAFFGALASIIILGDTFNIRMVIGGFLIILAIIVSETKLNFKKA
jgi:drug/metabolite transporter (DMT)-like permease